MANGSWTDLVPVNSHLIAIWIVQSFAGESLSAQCVVKAALRSKRDSSQHTRVSVTRREASRNGPVAQWIERRNSTPKVAGSSPAGIATNIVRHLEPHDVVARFQMRSDTNI